MAACNIKTKERIGEIGINNNGTKMQIIEYFGKDNMTVQFLDKYKYIIKNVSYGNFKKGKVINLYDKTFCGIGYLGEYLDNGIKLKDRIDYKYWTSMIDRCYGTNNIERHNNYLDCFVCEEWLCFANFEKWFKDNYYKIPNKKMQLDKDLISLCTNKIYCPEYCRFVPTDINHLFSTLFSSQNKNICMVFIRKMVYIMQELL